MTNALRLLAALALVLAVPVHAQTSAAGPHRQSGPRVGVTFLSPGVVDQINAAVHEGGVGAQIDSGFPVVTQVGWQFEFQTFQTDGGLTGVTEIVPLLSGLERGLVIPNLTWVIGLRTRGGLEAGIGPNVTLSLREADPLPPDVYAEQSPVAADVRVGLALVAGVNARMEGVSVPVNAAVVLGERGPRVSLLVGLNVSERRY